MLYRADMATLDIPGYTIIRPILRGGMTDIFVVTNRQGQRMVLRYLKKSYAEDRRICKKFLEGTHILRQMNHPNIVSLLDDGQHNGIPYMILEFVEGATLRDFLVRRDPDIQELILPLIRQMAAALYYCHRAGYLHLDIKPENIMLQPDARVVLIDFDLAQRRRSGSVRLRNYPGTPAYVAPEVLTTQRANEQADIFSFGVMTYEMITFRKPFERDTIEDSMRAQIDPEVSPLPIDPYAPDCPPALAALALKCLAKDLARRYPSMSLVIKAIDCIT